MTETIESSIAMRDIETARRVVEHDKRLTMAACQLAISLAQTEPQIVDRKDKRDGFDISVAPNPLLEDRIVLDTQSDQVDVDKILLPGEIRFLDAAKMVVGLIFEASRERIF